MQSAEKGHHETGDHSEQSSLREKNLVPEKSSIARVKTTHYTIKFFPIRGREEKKPNFLHFSIFKFICQNILPSTEDISNI